MTSALVRVGSRWAGDTDTDTDTGVPADTATENPCVGGSIPSLGTIP